MGMVVGLIGAGIAAYSQYQQGKSQQAIANYNSQVDLRNQKQAKYDAEQAQNDAARESLNAQTEKGRQLKSIKASYAAAGVQTGTGSPVEVLGEAAYDLDLQIGEIQRGGAYRAQDFRKVAQNYANQATLKQFEGRQAARAGAFAAGGTLFSGITSAFGQKIRLNKAGL